MAYVKTRNKRGEVVYVQTHGREIEQGAETVEVEHWTNRPGPAVVIGLMMLIAIFVAAWLLSGMPSIVYTGIW